MNLVSVTDFCFLAANSESISTAEAAHEEYMRVKALLEQQATSPASGSTTAEELVDTSHEEGSFYTNNNGAFVEH